MRIIERFMYRAKDYYHSPIPFGPFNFFIQRRWKKPVDSARTRLENRVRDLKIDKFKTHLNKLAVVLRLHHLMSTPKRGPFVSVQLMSRWKNLVGLNIRTCAFLRKYPLIFEVFTHPVRRNICCRLTERFMGLVEEEENVIKELESENVKRIKKLLMLSVNGTLHVQALRLIRRELGLPENFRESILRKYDNDFKLVDLEEILEVVDRDADLCVAEVERWREKEYREKWLSEFETKYAFPIDFPTGFKKEAGFKQKLRDWQRVPYIKPYERKEGIRVRSRGGIERYEKRAVGILHELLSLTVEKMVELERLAHFRKDFGIEVNFRELILKHQGMFYISTKGKRHMVFLREAYFKGCLINPNPVYIVRRKMLDFIIVRYRNALKDEGEGKEEINDEISNEDEEGTSDGDFVTLENSNTAS